MSIPKIRYILLILILTFRAFDMLAQNDELMIRLRAGHNASFGGFAAVSAETVPTLASNVMISGGAQYNTIGRTALERHYQPSFIALCSYDLNDYLGLSMGVGCKPAGMFNLSADYYQSFLNLGVCYSW